METHNIEITERFFENVVQFLYLETSVRNQNFIHKEIRRDWIWVMLATIQSKIFVFSSAIKKNLKIRIFKTTILPVVLYGSETWSRALRE
jgi:hypothetical protein